MDLESQSQTWVIMIGQVSDWSSTPSVCLWLQGEVERFCASSWNLKMPPVYVYYAFIITKKFGYIAAKRKSWFLFFSLWFNIDVKLILFPRRGKNIVHDSPVNKHLDGIGNESQMMFSLLCAAFLNLQCCPPDDLLFLYSNQPHSWLNLKQWQVCAVAD